MFAPLAIVLLSATFVAGGPAQQPRRTVWDGVYTGSQAERGRALFLANCSSCHLENLAGKGTAPALKGERFVEDWREYPLQSIFALMKTQMPPERLPGEPVIPDAAYVDMLAFLLQENAFPAGNGELDGESLSRIQLVRKEGPEPAPHLSLVLTVGCLLQLSETNWTLVDASEPARATIVDRTTPEELHAAARMPRGPQRFRLVNYDYIGPEFTLAPYLGQQIQVRGYLIRQPGAERINVTSVERVAPVCTP